MKNKRMIALAITAGMLIPASLGLAADLDSAYIDDAAKTLTVSGTPQDVAPGGSITLELLAKGKSSADISGSYTGTQLQEDFVFLRQLLADKNGGYTVIANMDGLQSGYYLLRVNGRDVKEIYYFTTEDVTNLFEQVQAACALTETEAVSRLLDLLQMESGGRILRDVLQIADPLVFSVDSRTLCRQFYRSNAGDSTLTQINLADRICHIAHIVALDEGKLDIVAYAEEFGLDEEYLKLYQTGLSDSVRASFVRDYYVGKGYDTAEKIANSFQDAVLLALCHSIDTWKDVEDFIDQFGEQAGVNMSDYNKLSTAKKNSLYTEILSKGSFSSISAFAAAANKEMTSLLSSGSLGSFSGSGSGGSGSYGGGYSGASTVGSVIGNAGTTEPIAPDTEDAYTFTDMTGFDWARESVTALAKAGIITGVGGGLFEPGRSVTREEMIAILMRGYGIEADSEETADFSDAAADGWYASYLAAASAQGFVNGREDGSFGVGDSITREDAAVMAYRIAGARGIAFADDQTGSFNDDGAIADYARTAVYALRGSGIISGMGDGSFAPKDSCTRAEAAKLVYMLLMLQRGEGI